MAARAAVLKEAKAADAHPCLRSSVSYAYGGATVTASGAKPAKAQCSAVAAAALRADASCAPAPKAECGFAGAWGGGGGPGAAAFYVSSYFFDRAAQAGALPAGAIAAPVTPRDFANAADEACAASPAKLRADAAAEMSAADSDFFCLDLAYCHALLTTGFGLEDDTAVTLVKQVSYRGKPVEAAWPLGAAIDALGATEEE